MLIHGTTLSFQIVLLDLLGRSSLEMYDESKKKAWVMQMVGD